jgi:prepilin-type N-terminal cleavage/methylation domain-containing protein/prepilin-type processing-associated H-X9-DG protein
MNPNRRCRPGRAFTLLELLCVIAIIGVLAALLLPALSKGKERALRIECVAHLQELGLAFHGFAHDHGSKFPMQVSARDGGSREFVDSGYQLAADFYFSFRHFQSLSNEAATPKILICPADDRGAARTFAALQNTNLSYFVNVRAEYGRSDLFLAGDRNITERWHGPATVVRVRTGNQYGWSDALHRSKGNILFADGHVEEMKSLPPAFADLFVPTAPPATPVGAAVSGNALGPIASTPPPRQPQATNRTGPDTNAPPPSPNTASSVTRPSPAATLVEAPASVALPATIANSPDTNAAAATVDEATETALDGDQLAKLAHRLMLTGLACLLLLLLLLLFLWREWRRRRRIRRLLGPR